MTFNHTYASAIVGAQKTHKRKEADFYPTPIDVTEALMRHLKLDRSAVIWEPAAGDGSMARMLERHVDDVLATDLRDESSIYGKRGIDFLSTTADDHYHIPDWIITNPPFNLAESFIRKSLSITSNVAMLLKSQYWHAAGRLGLFTDHPPSEVLPLTWRPAFLEKERGKSPLMDVIWVVWRAGCNMPTTFEPLKRPKDVQPLPAIFGLKTAQSFDISHLLGGESVKPEVVILDI